MPDREAFLRTICDHPDDDGPRLVLADWLEEQGDPRGEFIRLQCERLHLKSLQDRARLAKREDELLQVHGQSWAAELPQFEGVTWGPFRRGLNYNLKIDTVARFLALAPILFTAAPINEVWFGGIELDGAARLGESDWLLRLSTFKNLGNPIQDEGVMALVSSSNAANLRRLFLNGNSISDEGIRAITRSRYLKRLELLFLHNNRISDVGARLLAESTQLPQLTEVFLAQNEIHEAGVAVLKSRWGNRVYL